MMKMTGFEVIIFGESEKKEIKKGFSKLRILCKAT